MNSVKPAKIRRRTPLLTTFIKGLALSLGGGLLFRAGARQKSLSGLSSDAPRAVEELRDLVQDVERRGSEQISAMSDRLSAFERQVPELIHSAVASRIDEAERRIKGEMQELQTKTLESLTRTVDLRISESLGHLETSLLAQSREIIVIFERMNATDDNLNRVLAMIEGKHVASLMEATSNN